jgi:hypothetical protein
MPDEKTAKPRLRVFFGILLGMSCVGYGYFYLVSTMADPDVNAECQEIATLVESESSIPQSIVIPGYPAFFCGKDVRGVFLRPFDHVKVYGVIDRSQQDLVVANLKRARQQLKTRLIIADFYEKENWKTWSDPATGRSGGERGPETPTRRIVIE